MTGLETRLDDISAKLRFSSALWQKKRSRGEQRAKASRKHSTQSSWSYPLLSCLLFFFDDILLRVVASFHANPSCPTSKASITYTIVEARVIRPTPEGKILLLFSFFFFFFFSFFLLGFTLLFGNFLFPPRQRSIFGLSVAHDPSIFGQLHMARQCTRIYGIIWFLGCQKPIPRFIPGPRPYKGSQSETF
ncbi:hypothetical protein GGR50DRAFT_18789 [Xylaria sp. CBS 124048]|nr:hypothetical protein GGR50DRAFT_18789 [Xylaria sp. CBS 124048]